MRVTIDTNVFVGAVVGQQGYNRAVIRECLEGRAQPVMGLVLFLEFQDVLGRDDIFARSPLSRGERQELFYAFLSACEWVQVYYKWHPNLPDEGDNHLVELAVAASAEAIITNNVSDLRGAELRFPAIRILTPREFLEELI